ncbi:MAG: Flp family type IVb pilin [Caulobacter sp.]|nr:Flp family type IVb pilin [Caulobacter sp.]
MGKTPATRGLPDAASGRPAGRLALRLRLKAFWAHESGATAIEYGLIASLIFLVIVTSVTAFGNKTTGIMDAVSAAIDAAI